MNLYAWKNSTYNVTVYTISATPSVGDTLYNAEGVAYQPWDIEVSSSAVCNNVIYSTDGSTYINLEFEK